MPRSQGCSYGGANGGLFHDLLPDMLAEFNASNPQRCRLSELPYCACANAPKHYHTFPPPPPITFAESYHAYPAYEEGEQVVGGADRVFDADQGQASALAKRMTNVHTIDLALRSSHRTVSCPGTNDGEQVCARNCAAEHLTSLRAFTVTGAIESPSPPPSAPAESPAPPQPPPVPGALFSECQNTCAAVAEGDAKCRDGGKGSYLPTVCPYATQCAQCGFRANTRVIASDNSCATANNGVCEDGGSGTETFFVDPLYPGDGLTTSCALGTDAPPRAAPRRPAPPRAAPRRPAPPRAAAAAADYATAAATATL